MQHSVAHLHVFDQDNPKRYLMVVTNAAFLSADKTFSIFTQRNYYYLTLLLNTHDIFM